MSRFQLVSLARKVATCVVAAALWELVSFDVPDWKSFRQLPAHASSRDRGNPQDVNLPRYALSLSSSSSAPVFSFEHLRSVELNTNVSDNDNANDNYNANTTRVYCYNASFCCGRWNVNADGWWLHHPQWQLVLEDPDVGFCWAPTRDKEKRDFLQSLHQLQWGVDLDTSADSNSKVTMTTATNCSNLVTTVPISSGYGASLGFLYSTFWFAYTRGHPFQIIKRGPWMYALAATATATTYLYQNYTWADCPDRDVSCFYLPVSPCSRYDQPLQPKQTARPNPTDLPQVLQWLWLRDYMTRPNQGFRHAMAQLQQPYLHLLHGGCIALHVRRGDVGVPRKPFRRYAAIQEYLDLPPPRHNNATIFLLTDDASAIDELKQHFINSSNNNNNNRYNWVYTHKARNRGTQRGFDGHIPTDSHGPQELLWIAVEHELAATYCKTLVHGISGYATILWDKMRLMAGTHGQHVLAKYYLDTSVEYDKVAGYQGKPNFGNREAHLMEKVQAFYANQTTE